MVRSGWLEHGPRSNGGGRGVEPFVPVSWDRAFELVATELQRVKDTHGNKAIYGGSYGWASAGQFHHALSQIHRFLNQIGQLVGDLTGPTIAWEGIESTPHRFRSSYVANLANVRVVRVSRS